ncbi:hypothetical protein PPTG_14290 [Phytophthora nicotianae INRA-310]|uniref:Uncharacterized protein n=1 Tax=Phytophthora nicotianae (strain INRA-310) TaxID=761204 RepID=W2PXA9_PHYN3|nr:hypothetical protein PPTG_14290 [Phytophthora nicotianae INRA-310]ETN05593.1 hypothetical protein PPTG_14290 [Phytophthora nicotianae INRA-310]
MGYYEQKDIHSEVSTVREGLTFSVKTPSFRMMDSLGGGDEACDNRSATEPSFIFLDESTNGLDAHSERSSTMANSR